MKKTILAILLLAAPALAQPPSKNGPAPGPGNDPVKQRLFPPELIMSHQKDLAVSDQQRTVIMQEIDKAQPQIQKIQWQAQAAMESLGAILDAGQIDEAKALAAADKVMNLERDMKKAHLGLLIRIRNALTDTQRARLMELRKDGG